MPEKFQDLAKRWLSAKRTELLTGNRGKREAADAEADDTQRQMSDQAAHQAVRAAIPGLARWEDNQAARQTAAEEQERADILALPRVAVRLAVAGPFVTGSWSGEFPARVERSRDDDSDQVTLALELVTVDDQAPQLAGKPVYGLTLQVPRYTGPGRYDLTAHGADIDPLDYELALGYRDEGFFWSPDIGRATVEVAPGEQELTARLEMAGAGGDLSVTVTIRLP